MTILDVQDIHTYYGDAYVLQGLSLQLEQGQILGLLGRNGVGKTTIVNSIVGFTPPRRGKIYFKGADITGNSSFAIVRSGIGLVPQGRRVFPTLSVEDNLLMGAYSRKVSRGELNRDLDRVYATFPKLRDRRHQAAATLSGGEQQMCAIGRGLMSAPRLLMIDELSLGLSPLLVEQLVAALRALNAEGMSILLVEQDVTTALDLCHSAYIMDMGRIVRKGEGRQLLADPIIRDAYLGVLQG